MKSTRVFVDNVDTFLSRIPTIIAQQVMSPGAPDISHRMTISNSLLSNSTAGGMVKFIGKNYRQWAMYMEALCVHRGVWDVVSGLGAYNPADLEDATVITKKNNIVYLDMIITMRTRYQQHSLVRQLALLNKLFSWKCPNEANADKWVQEWCDQLKEFLSLQVRQEDFWKVVMVNNMPLEYGVAISSLGDISDVPIREIGIKLSARLWGLKGQPIKTEQFSETETAIVAKQFETRT
ncbi:hypothetical protein V1505DRAFT_359218 [Lipomyces doorenjongii]